MISRDLLLASTSPGLSLSIIINSTPGRNWNFLREEAASDLDWGGGGNKPLKTVC